MRHRSKPKFWDRFQSWREAEAAWDKRASSLLASHPLQTIKHRRKLPGIRPATRKNLRWKALKYLLQHDENKVMRYFWRRPWRHFVNMVQSYSRRRSYARDGDFFVYGFRSTDQFIRRLADEDTVIIIGFSYCHKPFECPSGRFSDQCIHQLDHPVCNQCFIGKCIHAMPEKKSLPVLIPTVHYIAEKVVEVMDENPDYEVLFVITACELTLEMFGDWGNSIAVRGIGVRLDGQICNTMKAFEASEIGIKPGLAEVLPATQRRILELIAHRRKFEHRSPIAGCENRHHK